jgi:hypothetical protein
MASKIDRFKFPALFGQLSLKILGRQQWLILRVEKDQQEIRVGSAQLSSAQLVEIVCFVGQYYYMVA